MGPRNFGVIFCRTQFLVWGPGNTKIYEGEVMSLYENIHKKRKSGRKMRAKGAKGAPTQQNFKDAARTARIKKGGKVKKK
jgi:hypothetical protein